MELIIPFMREIISIVVKKVIDNNIFYDNIMFVRDRIASESIATHNISLTLGNEYLYGDIKCIKKYQVKNLIN